MTNNQGDSLVRPLFALLNIKNLPTDSADEAVLLNVMTQPEVTIAIPTYNRANLLKRALGSALAQKGALIEIIISDDGSSDGTREFLSTISDDRIRCFTREKNAGMHINMSTCLNAARGKYFLMLSDDDYLENGCIEALLGPWRENTGVVMSYGQWWYERDGERKLQQSSGPAVENGFDYVLGCWQGKRPTIFHGALFETDRIRVLGGIPKGYAQDTLLKQRIALDGNVAYVEKIVTTYSFHSGSTTCSIDLFVLISDREAVLNMCLCVGREKGAPESYLQKLEDLGRKQFALDASRGIISLFAAGARRNEVLREALKLKRFLMYGILKNMPAVLMVLLLPQNIVLLIKKICNKQRKR